MSVTIVMHRYLVTDTQTAGRYELHVGCLYFVKKNVYNMHCRREGYIITNLDRSQREQAELGMRITDLSVKTGQAHY